MASQHLQRLIHQGLAFRIQSFFPRFLSFSYAGRISLYHPSLLPLQSCRTVKDFKKIHAHFVVSGLFNDPFSFSRLMKVCSSPDFGDLDYALSIFRQTRSPDTFTYNTLVKALALSSEPRRAVAFYFKDMLVSGGQPNSYTFPPLANACASSGVVGDGEKVHGQAVKNGVDSILFVQNALIHMYGCLGLLDCGRQVFNEMVHRDCVSWNAMLDVYVKSGDVISARTTFDEMPERNVVAWNTMIGGYLRVRNPGCGLKLFREMQLKGVKGTATTVVNALTGCVRSGLLLEGSSVHGYLVKNSIGISFIVATALMDMYGRCKRVDLAHKFFDKMLERNVVFWNVMIMAHATHGHAEDAIKLFKEMRMSGEVVVPDEVTLVAVLCACARLGAVDDGQCYLNLMMQEYNITPSFAHYWCLANAYGECGRLQEAEEIIKSMPMEAESFVWSRLLSYCRFRGCVDLGEKIAKELIELEPNNSARYALLLNIYTVAGRWEDVLTLKETMKSRGVRDFPGCSLVDLNSIVHEFMAGDRSRPEMQEIYSLMDEVVNGSK